MIDVSEVTLLGFMGSFGGHNNTLWWIPGQFQHIAWVCKSKLNIKTILPPIVWHLQLHITTLCCQPPLPLPSPFFPSLAPLFSMALYPKSFTRLQMSLSCALNGCVASGIGLWSQIMLWILLLRSSCFIKGYREDTSILPFGRWVPLINMELR